MITRFGKIHNSPGQKKWVLIQMKDALLTSKITCDEEIDSIRTAIVSGSEARDEMFERMLQEYRSKRKTKRHAVEE